MSPERNFLGRFEEYILFAVLQLGNEAYGAKIRQAVEEALEKSVSIGAVYATLDRLERKGFVASWQGESTPERGGRAKRYFKIEGAGLSALYEAEAVRRKLDEGVSVGMEPLGGTI